MRKQIQVLKYVLAAVVLVALTQCSDDELTPNEYVNTWIKRQMDIYYYWSEDMPNPRKAVEPDVYFRSLLSSSDDFSWIVKDYRDLKNSLAGINKEAGYDFKLYRESRDNNNVIVQVQYIKKQSLIDTEGIDLMRGDVIKKLNGETLTLSNYQTLLRSTGESHTVSYSRFNHETELWEDKGTVTLPTAVFAENPNLLSKVIEVNDRKIGYYVYNFFVEGPTAKSTTYDDQMTDVFASFKGANITDLVIDLRFNSGGTVTSARKLASHITNNGGNNVFARYQYNNQLHQHYLKTEGEEELQLRFIPTDQTLGALNNNRVYILTSYRTASASELIVNGLRPYMNVFLVGDTTVGKNEGSYSLYNDEDPKNTWGLQPIVLKIFNSQNQSDYDNGFLPDILNQDNTLEIFPLGDENEVLLNYAINHITGGVLARKSYKVQKKPGRTLGTSADFKRGSYNLVVNDKRVTEFLESTFP